MEKPENLPVFSLTGNVRFHPNLINSIPYLKITTNDVCSFINKKKYEVDYIDYDARLIKKYSNILPFLNSIPEFFKTNSDFCTEEGLSNQTIRSFISELETKYDSYDYLLFSLRREPGLGADYIFALQLRFALIVMKYLKDKSPKAKCIVGGKQFEDKEEFIKDHDTYKKVPTIDYFHKGFLTPKKLQNILKGNYRDHTIYTNPNIISEINLPANSSDFQYTYKDILDFYHIKENINFPSDKYIKLAELSLFKGCPGQCAFCVSANEKPEFMNFNKLTDMVMGYIDAGFNSFLFLNNCINPLANKFCDWLARKNLKINWADSSRHSLNPDYYSMLYEAGCRALHFGIETVDNDILAYVNKGFTHEQMHESLSLSHKAGIWNIVSAIVNLPYSKEDNHLRLYDYLLSSQEIIQSSHIFYFIFYGHTPFYMNSKKFNLEYACTERTDKFLWRETKSNGRTYLDNQNLANTNFLTGDMANSNLSKYIPVDLLFFLYDHYGDKGKIIEFLIRNKIWSADISRPVEETGNHVRISV